MNEISGIKNKLLNGLYDCFIEIGENPYPHAAKIIKPVHTRRV